MPTSPDLDLSSVSRLPLRVRYREFETAVSVLNRLAIRNGYSSVERLFSGIPHLPRRGRYVMQDLVAIAARINGTDEQVLAASSVARVGASFELNGVQVLSGRTAIQGRVCLGCLHEDVDTSPEWTAPWAPSLRDWWQVAQIASCPRHLLPLIGTCGLCDESLEMRRTHAAFCQCGSDLLARDVQLLPEQDVRADAYLLGRLGRGPPIGVPLLDELSFGSAAGLMLNLGVSLDPDVQWNRTWTPGAARSAYAARGLEVLTGGWMSFDAALSVARQIDVDGKRCLKLVGRYGRLQHWLGMERSEDLDPFRAKLVEHSRSNGAATATTIVFGSRVQNTKWTSMNAACAEIGLHPGPIFRLLDVLGLEDQATGNQRHDLISPAAVARVREVFSELVDSAEAGSQLGCDRTKVQKLEDEDVLPAFCPARSTATAYYRRTDLARVRDRFFNGLKLVRSCPPGLVPLRHARLGGQGAFESATSAVWLERLEPRAILVGEDGTRSIHNVLVASADLVRLKSEAAGAYSLTEAAPLLRLHRFTLGKLQAHLAPDSPRTRITADELRSIRRRFVTPREIAAAVPDLRPQAAICEYLRRLGIEPVLEGSYVQPLFERDAVCAALGDIPEEVLPLELREQTDNSLKALRPKQLTC